MVITVGVVTRQVYQTCHFCVYALCVCHMFYHVYIVKHDIKQTMEVQVQYQVGVMFGCMVSETVEVSTVLTSKLAEFCCSADPAWTVPATPSAGHQWDPPWLLKVFLWYRTQHVYSDSSMDNQLSSVQNPCQHNIHQTRSEDFLDDKTYT